MSSSLNPKTKSLEELVHAILSEVPYVDEREYSHNIISLCLRQIAETYGMDAANKAVRDCELEKVGWSQQALPAKQGHKIFKCALCLSEFYHWNFKDPQCDCTLAKILRKEIPTWKAAATLREGIRLFPDQTWKNYWVLTKAPGQIWKRVGRLKSPFQDFPPLAKLGHYRDKADRISVWVFIPHPDGGFTGEKRKKKKYRGKKK